MRLLSILLITCLMMVGTGCVRKTSNGKPAPEVTFVPGASPEVTPVITQSTAPKPTPTATAAPTHARVSLEQIIRNNGSLALDALKNKDMAQLADYVHPELGLRLSPYSFEKRSGL
jgi:PBP1b-binding outer membrane lipoprotein LpoB